MTSDHSITLPQRNKGYDLASHSLLAEIRGSRSYRSNLQKAAVELYNHLRKDAKVKAQVGRHVVVNDKPRATLTGFSPTNRNANLAVLEHLLHSLSYIASHLSEKLTLIGMPLSQEGYTIAGAYGHLSFPAAQRIIYGLHIFHVEDEPFLAIIPGTYDRAKGTGQVTRVKASRPALDWLTQKGLIFPNHPYYPEQKYDLSFHLQIKVTEVKEVPAEELEAQKAPKAEVIETKRILDRPLHGTERILPTSLQLLKKAKLSLPLPDYAFYERHWDWANKRSKLMERRNARLYRGFSEEDGRGGRIYGHWVQMLPSEARQHLTFNRQPSVELDYSSMQLALLYHLHGQPMPKGELYEIPGSYWPREACKAVLRISVGSYSKVQAVKSLAKELLGMRLNAEKAELLYDAFWDRHDGVRPHSTGSTPAWIRLQALDAQIALQVLCYLAEQEIPAVPIHDSFVVPAKYEAQCQEAMQKSFADYAPGISVMIKSTTEDKASAG